MIWRRAFLWRLIAWDPIKQEARWAVDHGAPWNGGILTTEAGLVFQGKMNGDVVAYDDETGDKLWSQNVNSGALSGLSSYEIDGEQYVAITTGWGTSFALSAGYGFENAVPPDVGRVVVFKLGGEAEIPSPMASAIEASPKGDAFGDKALVASGLHHYSQNCATCHGPIAISSGVLPDLRWSYATGDKNEWTDIVINGSRKENGMVSFKEQVTPEQAEAIRAYVMHQAHLTVANGEAGGE